MKRTALKRTALKRTAWKREGSKLAPGGGLKRSPMKRGKGNGFSTFKTTPREYKDRLQARREAKGLADEPYLEWLRKQVCGLAAWALLQWQLHRVVIDIGPCGGRIDPDHERHNVGMGQTAPDARAWSICRWHHDGRHGDAKGFWGSMTGAEIVEFIAERIDEHRARYLAELAAGGPNGGM
jgi:hypothetical protein